MRCGVGGLLALLLSLPVFAVAQSSDALRAQIRADLEASQPALSERALNVLVEELAQEAENSGEAVEYLAARAASTRTGFENVQTQTSGISGMPSQTIWLALVALLVLVAAFIMYRRRQLAP